MSGSMHDKVRIKRASRLYIYPHLAAGSRRTPIPVRQQARPKVELPLVQQQPQQQRGQQQVRQVQQQLAPRPLPKAAQVQHPRTGCQQQVQPQERLPMVCP